MMQVAVIEMRMNIGTGEAGGTTGATVGGAGIILAIAEDKK